MDAISKIYIGTSISTDFHVEFLNSSKRTPVSYTMTYVHVNGPF